MGLPPDENLPEVVPDQSPQALSHQEAHFYHDQLDGPDPKYPVTLDDAPKYAANDMMAPAVSDITYHDNNTTAQSPVDTIPWEPRSAVDDLHAGDRGMTINEKEEPTICGLKRRLFWLLLVVVLIIIAASIGGGVGGGLAASRSRENSGSGSAAESSSSSSASSTSAPSATLFSPTATSAGGATPSPTPTFLNNQTVPSMGFAFQAFQGNNYTGNATTVIRDEGFLDLPFNCTSYVWLPNSTDCCVTFCVNQTYSGGYWCQQRYQKSASGKFARIWIGCGDDAHSQHSCS